MKDNENLSETKSNCEKNIDDVKSSHEEVTLKKDAEETNLVKKLKNELNDYKDRLLRTAAEYENYRKRSEKEKDIIYSDALNFVILGILPIADSLEAAEEALIGQDEEYKKGIKLLKDQFNDVLGKLGVESFGEKGEKFEPSIHNAVSHIEEENEKQNEISKVFQKGYKSKNRIIRHAMVQVTN